MTIKFEVTNRWTGAVQFVAEIDCDENAAHSVKLGLAVKWGVKASADLAYANLAGANLAYADIAGVNLAGVNLAGANLASADIAGVNLAGANLASADLAYANLAGANLAYADIAGVNLAYADIAGVNLAGVNLAYADIAGVNLAGVNLAGANLAGAKGLTDAQLRPIIADYWLILTRARREIPALIAALEGGRVDGSTYSGECACLVGTLENSGATGLPHVADSPAECWFAAIRKGDKPGDDTAGGFASSKALQWALEYCDFAGIDMEAA